MLGFCILAPIGDAVAKILGNEVPLGDVVLIRFAVQVLILVPIIYLTGRAWRMRGRVLWYTFVRTILHVLGIAAMFTALKYLPLADAVAIVFVMPFFMLLLGHVFLQEEVGHRRLWACLVGFIGTLLVVQPSFTQVGWPALLPVFVAANFSVFMLITRKIAKKTDPIGLQAVSGAMAVALLLPLLWVGQMFGIEAGTAAQADGYLWVLLIGIGVIGTGSSSLPICPIRWPVSGSASLWRRVSMWCCASGPPSANCRGKLVYNLLNKPPRHHRQHARLIHLQMHRTHGRIRRANLAARRKRQPFDFPFQPV